MCWSNESALYTTNGEFQDCQLITSVSSGQFSDETINLYPNPAHGMVRLEVPADWGGSDVAIEIISSSGQMVHSHAATSLPSTWIDLQGLPPGMYLVRIHAQNRTYVRKLVLR
ncbi:MAG: T9SS C-terminal target domain-containing protein [Cryomorphaceae bacterium]|nr:MAG: T9SS C-terminal target domain-containing protein [Cryomorphaceae bacterium]